MSELIIWCLCSWLGAGTPRHRRSSLCHSGVWAGPAAPFPGALSLPDPARDARIERRRAADRAAASRALDRFTADLYDGVCEAIGESGRLFRGDYAE